MVRLQITALEGIPQIRPGDDLARILEAALQASGIELCNGDVLVLAQKVVSKAEGRIVDLKQVQPSLRAQALGAQCNKDPRLVEVILGESEAVVRATPDVLIVEHRLGFVLANAGVDASNVGHDDSVLLLPADPDASCAALRDRLGAATGADVGIVINDSWGRPWRMGTVGNAIGLAGVPGLVDLRGRPDLFGRQLRHSELAVADEVAAAASLLMGQADEGRPVVHLRGLPYGFRRGGSHELLRPRSRDLFR